jgi:ABC-type antimicrobial peptide transport system permease subunit
VLFGSLAALAVAVAAIGVYAVAGLEAARRRRELAIRLALGATRAGLQASMIGRTVRPVVVGVIVGLVAAWATLAALPWHLAELSTGFSTAAAAAALGMIVTAVSAVWLRTRRAVRVSPATFGRS